ncbi:hypothetical protein HDV62DRAFT_209031 [Trichoderma sp. SZMC 28011]
MWVKCAVFESSEWSLIIQYYTRACVTVHMPQSIGKQLFRAASPVEFIRRNRMREKTLCLPTDAYHLLDSRHLIPVVHLEIRDTDCWHIWVLIGHSLDSPAYSFAKWTGWRCCTTSCSLASYRLLINPPHKGASSH